MDILSFVGILKGYIESSMRAGIYRGVVKDVADPLKLGRVRVYVPDVHGMVCPANDKLKWASPCSPYGGYNQEGMVLVPSVNATVWVMYEGKMKDPVWVGTWWGAPGGTSEIPTESEGNPPNLVILKFGEMTIHYERSSQSLIIQSSGSNIEMRSGEIILEAGGAKIEMSGDSVKITGDRVDLN
jgi:hypothetical protein